MESVVKRIFDDCAVAGAFEELPALLVVLVAVSLFSVSVAHAAMTWGEADDRELLQDDCQTFAGMVRYSDTLSAPDIAGVYDVGRLQNLSTGDFLEEFNSTRMGFGYRVVIQCIDLETGNVTLDAEVKTSDVPVGVDIASAQTCVSVDNNGCMEAARVTVTIWRAGS